jgi:hypothetical protein
MKILFLDIDGVVNNKESFARNPIDEIDEILANKIKAIQLSTGCNVVLSSMWRLSPVLVSKVEEKICKVFDSTIESTDLNKKERGDEIAAWLTAHPEVKKYAIIDDDIDILLEQLPNFFNTSFDLGITDDIMFRIIKHLNS